MPVEDAPLKDFYKGFFRKGILFMFILIALTLAVSIASISMAKYPVSFSEAYHILSDRLNGIIPATPPAGSYSAWMKDHIVWEMNLPRAIGGVIVGAILGAGGAMMQSVVKNPLADPYTTGISSGAMFGVTVYLVLGISIIPFAGGDLPLIVNAFVFALIPAAVIIFVSSFKKTSPTMMVLIGIGVMYIFSASTTLLKFTASSDTISDIYIWSVGSIGKITWDNIPLLICALIFILVLGMFLSKTINILTIGDKSAISLGINPSRARLICLTVISVSTAVAVCFTGTIGFVGLVAPHMARMVIGSNMKYLLPCSAVIGGFMLIAADCIARNAGTTGLPVGVITALIGSPLFLYFLIKQRKGAWG